MKIVFCNIAYLNYYDGRIIGELKPITGGRWVKENEDAHEKWNFLNYDGTCYGYVQSSGEQLHIERYDNVASNQENVEGMTVVWCAEHPTRGTVVVGWYKNAIMHRYCQYSVYTVLTGLERCYWFETKAENAYLLPEEYRTFAIGRASKTGTGTGFGRGNIWYAESEYAKKNIIPDVVLFMEQHEKYRINTQPCDFEQGEDLKELSDEEWSKFEKLEDEVTLKKLAYAYRAYAYNPGADAAYIIGKTLMGLYQFAAAIPWYEKVLVEEPNDIESMGILMYLYQQCQQYEKSSEIGKRILDQVDESEKDFVDEIYCAYADNSFFAGDIDTAIKWLDKIIEGSENSELVNYTKETRQNWLNRKANG